MKFSRRYLVMGLICTVGMAFAGPPQTTVSVEVKNNFDKPVDNAAVILDFLGSHQITKMGKRKPVHWEVHTDQNGRAHFPPVPQGTIRLQVIAKDYQTFGKEFEVEEAEKTIDVQLQRPQSQYSAHPPLKQGPPESHENPR